MFSGVTSSAQYCSVCVRYPCSRRYAHPSRYQPGGKANMFTYTGPRNLRVAGLWDEPGLYAAAYQDLLKRVHVLVGTPDYLSRVAVSGKLQLQNVTAMVIDEADACLDAALAKIRKCWAPFSHRPVNRRPALARRVVAAGAVEVPAALSADDVAALTALADCVARWGPDRKPAERPFHDHSGASLVWALGWYLQRVAPELTERLYAIAAFAAAGHFAVDPGSPPALGLPRAPRPARGGDDGGAARGAQDALRVGHPRPARAEPLAVGGALGLAQPRGGESGGAAARACL